MSQAQAKAECSNWNSLITVYLNSEDLRLSIKEWSKIDSELDYLFSNNPIKQKSEMFKKNVAQTSDYPSFIPTKEIFSPQLVEFDKGHPNASRQKDPAGPNPVDLYPKNLPKKESFRQISTEISSKHAKNNSASSNFLSPDKRPPVHSKTLPQRLTCDNNHDLKWSVTTPFVYFNKSKSF